VALAVQPGSRPGTVADEKFSLNLVTWACRLAYKLKTKRKANSFVLVFKQLGKHWIFMISDLVEVMDSQKD
jgi:hypothetical protein